MTYWQVAAGDEGRNYSDLFFEYGIMCVGGENQIKTLMKVEEGDTVILKRGKSEILGAGKIIKRDGVIHSKDEKWLGDFDGWDLRSYTNVEWHRPEKPIPIHSGLAIGTIMKLWNIDIQKIAHTITTNYPKLEPKPKPNQDDVYTLKDDEIVEFLISEGFRPGDAEELTNTFNRIRLLANFYYNKCNWYKIREHETRTFLIMPLLFALGWSEQKLKIEHGIKGGRIDIAAFSKPFLGDQDDENKSCKLIIESKAFSVGLDYATKQAVAYAKAFPNCKKIIVSNGFCYKAFLKKGDTFSTTPFAYMNLLKPTNKHPLYPNSKGTLELFKLLLP